MNSEDTVTITREEYLDLLEDSSFLLCLAACGVDNWIGYDDAREMFNQENAEMGDVYE
ncbi:MAG TPA: hypothetical protein VFQ47_05335 [Nitrososphaera sp.]|nr:hypothetical protein [Nitrososphaera sp.]